MHNEIREKGGAYGGGSSYSLMNGVFSFYSYRDPNPINSISKFESVNQWLRNNSKFEEQDLLEAKLSAFGDLDSLIDFHYKGINEVLLNMSASIFQSYRDKLLAVRLSNIYECIEKYFKDTQVIYTVIGPNSSAQLFSPLTHVPWIVKKA